MRARLLAAVVLTASLVGIPADAAVPKTRITIVVDGCDDCTIQPQQASAAGANVQVWRGKDKRVGDDGVVTFRVPTARTKGMAFDISPDWQGPTGYQPSIVVRYSGKEPGDKVGKAYAKKAARDTGCWAGTDLAEITIKVKVRKLPTTDYNGNPTFDPLAWVSPTLPSVGPLEKSFNGTTGHQDAYYCKTS